MPEKSFDFLENGDSTFRKKIDGCLVSFAEMLDKYQKHVAETPENDRKSAADFLKEDILLEMMINDFGCFEEAISAMNKYAGTAK